MITHNLFWEDPYKKQASSCLETIIEEEGLILKNHFFILQVEANHVILV